MAIGPWEAKDALASKPSGQVGWAVQAVCCGRSSAAIPSRQAPAFVGLEYEFPRNFACSTCRECRQKSAEISGSRGQFAQIQGAWTLDAIDRPSLGVKNAGNREKLA